MNMTHTLAEYTATEINGFITAVGAVVGSAIAGVVMILKLLTALKNHGAIVQDNTVATLDNTAITATAKAAPVTPAAPDTTA